MRASRSGGRRLALVMSDLLRELRALTTEMDPRLGKLFRNSSECWLNLQCRVDIGDASQGMKRESARIRGLQVE